jgi:hypothetical protein
MSKLNSISFLATKFSKLQFGLIKLIGVLAITSSVSFASADQDSNLLQIIDGYVFGTNATVSVVADDELNKDVVELQILESGNFEQAYVGFPLNQEDFSTASAFEFKVLDQQGSNTVYITLVDSAGDKWSGWSSDQDKTVLNAWTNIEFDYTSAVSSIDLTQVSEVRFALWNAGTYRFSDVALLSSSDVIDTVNVTFQVDMSAVETNAEGVYLAGGGFGQDGHLMTDNGSDVWSVTVDVNANSTALYKFRNQPSYGTWDGFEDQAGLVIGGCATGQHNDRFVDVAEADITLPVVAYGSCTAEPYVSGAPAVSFTVTASDAAEVKFHSSGFNWQEASQVVAVANGDGTWTAIVDPGFANGVEYKWIIDGVEEDLSTAYRNAECANDNVAGYDDTWFNRTWAADSGDVTGDIAGACSGTGPSGSWDFDNDGNADALTDGLLLLRYTFGLTGVSLTDSAIASGSPLTPAEVEANVATATTSFADIDGSGNVDALTDGLMLLRYLFGLTGASLIDSAVAAGAERTTAADIEAYIQSLIP